MNQKVFLEIYDTPTSATVCLSPSLSLSLAVTLPTYLSLTQLCVSQAYRVRTSNWHSLTTLCLFYFSSSDDDNCFIGSFIIRLNGINLSDCYFAIRCQQCLQAKH